MHAETALVLLFAAATAVAIAARRLNIPYTVALVLAGLGLGATHVIRGVHLTRDLLYSVFLPGLIFEASYNLKFSEFRENARAILALAVPGVVVAIGATATLLVTTTAFAPVETGFGWSHALVFAAIVAATDPIAVVALFRSLGAPPRLAVLMDGESLVNDGTAIVLTSIVYTAVRGGGLSLGAGTLQFVEVVGLGVVLGAIVGFAASHMLQRVEDPMIEITVTTIAAYGGFAAADALQVSGVIATMTVGMVCGSFGAPRMNAESRIAVESFWRYLAFALNSVVFLLIGLEVRTPGLLADRRPILLAFAAVVVGRGLVVSMATVALRRTNEAIPWRWSLVLTWGGLRGALCMVLALALDEDFPHREIIVTMTFGVVFLSIVVQGLTTGPLLRALGLAAQDPGRVRGSSARG
jgi:CPA1 family monovalent cation:H+ antiporter